MRAPAMRSEAPEAVQLESVGRGQLSNARRGQHDVDEHDAWHRSVPGA
jgi:hypothetical protein